MSSIWPYIAKSVAFAYGMAAFAFCAAVTVHERLTVKRDNEGEEEALRKAYHNLWSLETTTSDWSHQFLKTSSGIQLHYLLSVQDPVRSTNLVILVHGFPDSCFSFSDYLSGPLAKSATIVALDLPGYGASESPSRYSATEVLNAVAEGIVELRKRYLVDPQEGGHKSPSKCICVSHDWGAVICYRIAAEAGGLVDRVIAINSAYLPHTSTNVKARFARAGRSFKVWRGRIGQVGPLRDAWKEVSPVLIQLLKSNYIFMFNLPFPLASWFPSVTNFLLDACHRLAYQSKSHLPTNLHAHSTAASNGPSIAECSPTAPNSFTGADALKYGPDVLSRARSHGAWDQRIRLYREGAATGRWEQSSSLVSFLRTRQQQQHKSSAPLSTTAPAAKTQGLSTMKQKHRFTVPMTVVFGMQDPALDPRLCLDGIEGFFTLSSSEPLDPSLGLSAVELTAMERQNHVIRMPKCGHWSLLEPTGREVIQRILLWCVDQGEGAGRKGMREGRSTGDRGRNGGSLAAELEPWARRGDVVVTTV